MNIKKYIPNITTLANMAVGVLSISILVNGSFHKTRTLVSVLVLVSAFLDFLDGKFARILKQVSKLGKELDSFADIISFGVAPMMIMLSFVDTDHPIRFVVVYVFASLYMVCATIRLARFNISDHKNYFLGLPITASGVILAIFFIISENTRFSHSKIFTATSLLITAVLSVLMVLNFKVHRNFSIKDIFRKK